MADHFFCVFRGQKKRKFHTAQYERSSICLRMDSSTIRNPFQTEIMMAHWTKESFKNKVFDFEANQEWSFAGDKPCIIDFYADWCNPCKIVAPILENLVEEYQGNSTFTRSTPRRNRSLRQCSTSAASPPFFLSQRMANPRGQNSRKIIEIGQEKVQT